MQDKKNILTPRERVERALNHEEADKIPVDFGATGVTGIAASVVNKLRQYYGLKDILPVKVAEPYQILGEIAGDLKEKLGVDCIGLWDRKNLFGYANKDWKRWQLFDGTPVLVPDLFNTKLENNGSILQYPEGDVTVEPSGRLPRNGYYFDAIIRQESIDDNKLNVKDNLEEFKLISEDDLKYYTKEANYLFNNTDFAIVGSFGGASFGDIALVPATFLKNPKGIRDIEEWYISIIARKEYIFELFSRQCEIALENFKLLYQAVSNKISVIYITGTDFGTQNSTFISLETYRQLFKPFHKKINEWVHKNTKWKTFLHSCGAIEPLIDEFIEAGFDILNPVQISANGMDPTLLKEKYGKDLVFWGGGVDTQKTLPFGTPEEVRNEVEQRLKIFSKGGGYIFNTIHNIQAKTPTQNIISMIDAVNSFRM